MDEKRKLAAMEKQSHLVKFVNLHNARSGIRARQLSETDSHSSSDKSPTSSGNDCNMFLSSHRDIKRGKRPISLGKVSRKFPDKSRLQSLTT